MYVIVRKIENRNLFYRFSIDGTDLYCVATDNLETCMKYTEGEMTEYIGSPLLKRNNVKFKKIGFNL